MKDQSRYAGTSTEEADKAERAHFEAIRARETAERAAREQVERDQERRRKEHSWAEPLVAGVAGAAAGAVIADLVSDKRGKDREREIVALAKQDLKRHQSCS